MCKIYIYKIFFSLSRIYNYLQLTKFTFKTLISLNSISIKIITRFLSAKVLSEILLSF